jgi:hypothetical protein
MKNHVTTTSLFHEYFQILPPNNNMKVTMIQEKKGFPEYPIFLRIVRNRNWAATSNKKYKCHHESLDKVNIYERQMINVILPRDYFREDSKCLIG